jgi:alanine racemase
MNPSDEFTSYIRIDLDALTENVRAIKAHIGPGVSLISVVKANAYGHGLIPIARTALTAGASRLAVARVDEGIALRQAGINAPVLVMGYAIPAEARLVVEYQLTPTITSLKAASSLSDEARTLGRRVGIHVKVDTGMGRYGLLPDEVLPFLSQVIALPGLELEGIYTHFASADSADRTFTRYQFSVFVGVLEALFKVGIKPRIRHAANSAAALDLPETHLDAVRIGVAQYGLHPSSEVSPAVPLRPVLSLHSHVARLHTLAPRSSVGYGRTFIAKRTTQAALIPVGYGDGYHRALSGRAEVLIGKQFAPILGRVSMDQIVADVTSIPGVHEGDEVVLLGSQGDERISAEEVAAWGGTINYEVTTSLLPRLPRVYVRDGEIVEVIRMITAR